MHKYVIHLHILSTQYLDKNNFPFRKNKLLSIYIYMLNKMYKIYGKRIKKKQN